MRESFKRFEKGKRRQFMEKAGVEVPDTDVLLYEQSAFERPQPRESIVLAPGVRLDKDSISLDGQGSFVNSYDLSVDSELALVSPFTVDVPIHLKRILQNDPSVVAVTNGGFFFLADHYPDAVVGNSNLQLDIRPDGIYGLPVADRPFLCGRDGKIRVLELSATGTFTIGGMSYTWRGSRSAVMEAEAVLYTDASGVIEHENAVSTGLRRVVRRVETPRREGCLDAVIGRSASGMVVTNVHFGGGSSVYAGLGVIQLPASSSITVGDTVSLVDIGGVPVVELSPGFSIGPSIGHVATEHVHEINHDLSLGSNPPLGSNRIA